MKKIFVKNFLSKFIAVLVATLTLTSQAFAVILERGSIKEIAPLIDKNTLVVFDIDNTLIRTPQSLGSAEWFLHVYSTYRNAGFSDADAKLKAQDDWYRVAQISEIIPVEKRTAKFVHKLQKNKIQVIGLTARPANHYDITKKQLHDEKINLSKTAAFPTTNIVLAKGVQYKNGIIFVDEQDKGEALIKFLTHFEIKPEKVVFVDDVSKNTQDVEAALTKAGIQVSSVRYGATDKKVNAFDAKITDIQWDIFNKQNQVISNAAAQKFLN